MEIQIERIEVQVLASYPPRVQLAVKGVLADGCTHIDKEEQTRQGNEITVRITAIRQPDTICIMATQAYERLIPLNGPFGPGSYTVIVNNLKKSFSI